MTSENILRILRIDPDGTLVMSDPEYCDGDEYGCGETLAEFGLDNLTAEEKKALGRQEHPVKLKAVVVVDLDVHNIERLDGELASHLATWFLAALTHEDREDDDYYVRDLTVYPGLVGFDADRREMIADFAASTEDAWELGNQVAEEMEHAGALEAAAD